MNDIPLVTVCFGKAEEMDKCFYSLKHYIDISIKKIVFINTSIDMKSDDNVQVFKKYYNKDDRCFVCNDNYYSSPYRYAITKLIPSDTKYSIGTESDIWLTKTTDYFSKAHQLMEDNPQIGMCLAMTKYYTSKLAQKKDSFADFIPLEQTSKGSVPWHFALVQHYVLQRYVRSKRGEINDIIIQGFCTNKVHKKVFVKDLRDRCIHLDDYATFDKYPEYKKYYRREGFYVRQKRAFNEECFTEV